VSRCGRRLLATDFRGSRCPRPASRTYTLVAAPPPLVAGKVLLDACEAHIIYACNLSCRACNHAMPAVHGAPTSPGDLRRDLNALARVAHARRLRILGGEPLLHPEIDTLLAEARAVGIADEIHVVTNGLLLERMTPRFWELVDRVVVSLHTRLRLRLPRPHAAKVITEKGTRFRETFSLQRNADAALVERVRATCTVGARCVGLVEGRFYPCMRAPYIVRAVGLPPETDGLSLDGLTPETLVEALAAAPAELRACEYCVGTAGAPFPVTQLTRDEWMATQGRPVAEMMRKRKWWEREGVNGE
jgi:hypothetical protein